LLFFPQRNQIPVRRSGAGGGDDEGARVPPPRAPLAGARSRPRPSTRSSYASGTSAPLFVAGDHRARDLLSPFWFCSCCRSLARVRLDSERRSWGALASLPPTPRLRRRAGRSLPRRRRRRRRRRREGMEAAMGIQGNLSKRTPENPSAEGRCPGSVFYCCS